MHVLKYDTMISLMPEMCLTTMHQDIDEDDIDGYGRLVIDIPDLPDDPDNTTTEDGVITNTKEYKNAELRDDQAPPVTKDISSSTQMKTLPIESMAEKVLPLKHFRDIPIKLLLKRSFQNSRNKPHKKRQKYDAAENEEEKLNPSFENEKIEFLPPHGHESNYVEKQEISVTSTVADNNTFSKENTKDTADLSTDKQIILNLSIKSYKEELLPTHVQNHIVEEEQNRTCVVAKRIIQEDSSPNNPNNTLHLIPNTQHVLNLSLNRHKEELVTSHKSDHIKQYRKNRASIVTNNVNQRASLQSTIKHCVVAPEQLNSPNNSIEIHKKESLTNRHYYTKKVEKRDKKCTIVDNVAQITPPQNYMTHLKPAVNQEKKDTPNCSVERYRRELLSANKHYLNKLEEQYRECVIVDSYNRTSPSQNYMNHSSTLTGNKTKKQNYVKKSTKNHIESLSNRTRYADQIKNEISYNTDSITGKMYQRDLASDIEQKQRISVVSNDFLFREKLGKSTETKSLPQENNNQKAKCPQRYQEALIEFMERRYQLALRENIPLTVNTKPDEDPLRERPNTSKETCISQEVKSQNVTKNTLPSQEKSLKLVQQNKKPPPTTTPTAVHDSTIPANVPGYNILVHRGPDINKIVITIANENDDNNQNTNIHSPSGDQRVPESISTTTQTENRKTNHKKQSYFYKEPSLRSFRRRFPNQRGYRQTRNTIESKRLDSTEHHVDNYTHMASPHHYSYIENYYDLPTPVIENYYGLGTHTYYDPVMPGLLPWDLYDKLPITSDQVTRRSINGNVANIPSSQKQHYLDPYEQEIVLRPLNLSVRPLTVEESPYPYINYPEVYSNYPVPVHDYY